MQRIGHVGCRHGGAQLPGQDVAREVIEHGGQIEPAPADDLQEVKSVCQSWFGAVVGLAKRSAAFIRMKAGLVIRPWSFKSRSCSRSAAVSACHPPELDAALLVSTVPVVERRSRDPDWSQCPTD